MPFSRSENVGALLQAIGVGLGGGVGAIVFRWLIASVNRVAFAGGDRLLAPVLGSPFVVLLPIVGLVLVSNIVRRWAPEAQGHGVPEV
ncbi:MAG: chloride channel protein, partial [Proteobacteria bacterium]|nr:chloride channel protein [Pseudomonadota bacterium]